MSYKKKQITLNRCGDFINCTPVTDKHHLLDLQGNSTMGTCPYWNESRCTLLSWESNYKYFKRKLREL
jgi:hypothetical protein